MNKSQVLKIAYLITRSDTVGGAHVHVLDLASRARADGHEVEVLVGGNGPYASMLRKHDLSVVNLRFLARPIRPHLDAMAVLECWREFRRMRPDIVHAHSTKAGLVGRVAAKLAGLPVVFTAHGWAFTEGVAEGSRRLSVFLEKSVARLSDAIICVSEYDRELALRLGVGSASLNSRIHNGVPDVPLELRYCGSRGDTVRIVSVARLDEPKDHMLLLHALAMIKDLPWALDIIGDGPLIGAVRRKACELGLRDRVEFLGLCNDVPVRLARSDIFVLVSKWEGLPLSILEAMRARLPVVASNVGGVAESITDGVTGFLVPRGDKAVLADRLKRLLQGATLRQRMGNSAREVFEREFSFDVMYTRTQQIYRGVLERKGAL